LYTVGHRPGNGVQTGTFAQERVVHGSHGKIILLFGKKCKGGSRIIHIKGISATYAISGVPQAGTALPNFGVRCYENFQGIAKVPVTGG
jgi:hypothetical protein